MANETGKPIIQVKGLDKSFAGVHAVNNFSFDIYEGEILGLIGPNGCGKSTSVNLMTGVYTQDSGEILYYGKDGKVHDLKDQAPPARAKLGIGRTFQTPKPFTDMTVFENVYAIAMLYNKTLKEARAKTEEIISFVGFSEIADMKCTKLPIEKRKWLDMARVLALTNEVLFLHAL